MGIWENFKNLMNVSEDDDFEDDFDEETENIPEDDFSNYEPVKKPEREPKPFRSEKKVVSYNSMPSSQMQVVLVRPDRFEDVTGIADNLNLKKTVVLNLESADRDTSRRILDFLSGVAYANHGSIKKVANSTFIIVPTSVDVSGELMYDDTDTSKLYY